MFDHTLASVWARALRVHQWAKNVLVLLPVLTSHTIAQYDTVLHAGVAVLAFCMTSSATYLLNDVCDLANDRAHDCKRHRPIAAGTIGVPQACIASISLLGMACSVAILLPPAFGAILAVYFVTTVLYSVGLKKFVMLDVVVLAMLYVLRVLAGHSATGIPHSVWLTTFSLFLFYGLALLKRAVELRDTHASTAPVAGRGYVPADLPIVESLGVGSGLVSVLVIAVYVKSPDVVALYRNSQILLFICPVILFWIGRLWVMERRGELHHDPVVFALMDSTSYVVAGVIVLITFLAAYWP